MSFKNKLKAGIIAAVFSATVFVSAVLPRNYVHTYAVPSESNELHYEYYTEALCRVVSVSPDETEVTVRYKGNDYTFETDGCTDCKVGEKWLVTFNENMEIISVE
jgi:membrane protein implicated in regulation of membrane protease activity